MRFIRRRRFAGASFLEDAGRGSEFFVLKLMNGRFSLTIRVIVLMAFAFVIPSTVNASLQWDTKNVELSAAVSDTNIRGTFKFTNTGTNAVTIRNITTNCSCTTATSSKMLYSPSDRGEIVTDFEIATRSGNLKRTILIETDNPVEPKTELTLAVNIPVAVTVEPNVIIWKKNDSLDERVIEIAAKNGFEIKTIEPHPENPGGGETLITSFQTIQDGKQFRFTVKPKTKERQIFMHFLIEVNHALPTHKVYSCLVIVH